MVPELGIALVPTGYGYWVYWGGQAGATLRPLLTADGPCTQPHGPSCPPCAFSPLHPSGIADVPERSSRGAHHMGLGPILDMSTHPLSPPRNNPH